MRQQQELQKYNNNNTTKPDIPNRTFSLYRNNESSSELPKPSALMNRQGERQREMPSSSISYTDRRITTPSKTKAEEDEQIKPYQDEWDRSEMIIYDNT